MTRTVLALVAALTCFAGAAAATAELKPEELVARYGPAVVFVQATAADGSRSQGTAFVLNGLAKVLVTNLHVIREATALELRLPDGQVWRDAQVLGYDAALDLAVLRVQADAALPSVRLGEPDKLPVGARVYVIGNPKGLANTVTDGLYSGSREAGAEAVRLMQISAPLSPGSSGSPVFDGEGRVVGVATSREEGAPTSASPSLEPVMHSG